MALFLVFLLSFSSACTASFQPSGAPFKSPVTVAPGFAAHVLFSNLTLPRGITFDSAGTLLVVERGLGITAFAPAKNSSVPGWERSVVVANANFTQGIQVDSGALYVSTPGEVLRYVYDAETSSVSTDPPVTVVNGIPPDGDLTTHTLQLQHTPHGPTNILIATGPFTNIDPTARDPNSGRSQIRRLPLPPTNASPSTPTSFLSGTLIAYGIRNPAGFAFSPLSPFTTLYAVENGASIDNVTNLTSTFVNDNPADELEEIDLQSAAVSYGFPDCTTLWNPQADPVGVPQYVGLQKGAQISLQLEEGRGDAFCQEENNNKRPALSFQAHSVPLDVKFYTPPSSSASHAFPAAWKNDAFVSFHGSFDRTPPTGYGVVHVPFPLPPTSLTDPHYTFLVQAATLTSCTGPNQGGCIRPVGLAFGVDGKLYISSDSSGELFVLEKV